MIDQISGRHFLLILLSGSAIALGGSFVLKTYWGLLPLGIFLIFVEFSAPSIFAIWLAEESKRPLLYRRWRRAKGTELAFMISMMIVLGQHSRLLTLITV